VPRPFALRIGIMALSARTTAAIAAVVGVALVIALGFLVRLDLVAEDLDAEWMDEIVDYRSSGWEVASRVLDFIGGGWFAFLLVPIVGATVLLLLRRPWAALAFVLAVSVSAGVVPLLKGFFGRARPEEILIQVESAAYPSGHAASAASLAVALALLIGRWQAIVIGAVYVMLMSLSRTHLGAHWVSDTLGGALLGASPALAVWAIFAPRIRSEQKSTPPPASGQVRAVNESL